jgi:hypothetical protein
MKELLQPYTSQSTETKIEQIEIMEKQQPTRRDIHGDF